MITCRKLVEFLIDYVSGELAPEHKELVDHHLRICAPCVAYLQTYQTTIRLTRQLPPAPMPPSLCEKLRACMQEICGRQGQASDGDR